MARQTVAVLVWSVSIMLVLSEIGLDLGPILAGAGVVGLAIGFGAQTLVKDLIGGFFILFENQFRVGDVISTSGVAGLVEAITLRTTILRDLEAKVHVIPNGSIGVVTNFTREWSRPVLDIGVAYKEDTDNCMAVLKEVGDRMEAESDWSPKLTGPFEYLGVNSLGDSSVVLRMMVKTRPMERWNVLRELNRRVKKAFDERGIEIPFPHMTLYMGDESSNNRLRVDMGQISTGVATPSPARESR
jgi:small conductance mechanosensitive channel